MKKNLTILSIFLAMVFSFGLVKSISAAVIPGTDMTAEQLRVFYSVNFTKANFQPAFYCVNGLGKAPGAYQALKTFFNTRANSYMFYMVNLQESHGYDVPTA